MKTFLFVLLLTFLSCNKQDPMVSHMEVDANLVDIISEEDATSAAIPPPPPKQEEGKDIKETISKKIIKNGDMGITVGNISEAKKQVDGILKTNNAYIQNENFRNTETSENLEIVIRVPHQNFDRLINSFSTGIGALDYKNISADDVTEEYTDVFIKLENKKIYLEKYRDLLKKCSDN